MPQRRKPGRPPKDKEARLKNLCVRLTGDELDAFRKAAKARGKQPTVWLRELGLRAAKRLKAS